MGNRLIWVDQAKGIGIFLMIYAHNFPITEAYIYSFHMPLFFLISGMFHPSQSNKQSIIHRFKAIIIPYFIWSSFLYLFWFFLGRHYGDSALKLYDPIKNFIGIFYAQGDVQFMNWGIPMWFLPCIFLTFVFYSIIQKIQNVYLKYFILISLIIFGFIYPRISDFHLPWSIDIACVSLVFYKTGNIIKNTLPVLLNKKLKGFIFLLAAIHFSLVFFNSKIDMYRSIYGNEILFIINGLSGSILVLLLCKLIKFPKILSYLGKHTIPLLALQARALTVIKFCLVLAGITVFNFNEPTKFFLTFLQILLIIPVIIFINKYAPLLDGKPNKK